METQKLLLGQTTKYLFCFLVSFITFNSVASERKFLEDGSNEPFHMLKDEDDFMQIKDMPFAKIFIDPCTYSYKNITDVGPEQEFFAAIFISLGIESRENNLTVQSVIDNFALKSCERECIDNLKYTTTYAELKKMKMEEALKKMYLSLLVHSAFSFLIHLDAHSEENGCWAPTDEGKTLAGMSYHIAQRLKASACMLYFVMRHLGCMNYKVAHIIPNDFTLFACSKRQFRICQVMKSTERLLQEISNYADEESLKYL